MSERARNYIVIAFVYMGAYLSGFPLFLLLEAAGAPSVAALFAWDIASTAVIWLIGVFCKNASFYDPYWSVTPPVMLLFLLYRRSLWSPANFLLLAVLSVWAIRLTYNWAETFTSLRWEDWRYRMYRERYPHLWPVVNLLGIHLMPTILVFAGMLPAFAAVSAQKGLLPDILPGAVLILIGTGIEALSDRAMHRHLESPTRQSVCREGLWRYSRHPNYLGEILIWVGVLLFAIGVDHGNWRYFPGALAVLLLFVFVSIPMAEERQTKRREGYEEYRKTTSMLLLWKEHSTKSEP